MPRSMASRLSAWLAAVGLEEVEPMLVENGVLLLEDLQCLAKVRRMDAVCRVDACRVDACRVDACRVGACGVGACRVGACRVGACMQSGCMHAEWVYAAWVHAVAA